MKRTSCIVILQLILVFGITNAPARADENIVAAIVHWGDSLKSFRGNIEYTEHWPPLEDHVSGRVSEPKDIKWEATYRTDLTNRFLSVQGFNSEGVLRRDLVMRSFEDNIKIYDRGEGVANINCPPMSWGLGREQIITPEVISTIDLGAQTLHDCFLGSPVVQYNLSDTTDVYVFREPNGQYALDVYWDKTTQAIPQIDLVKRPSAMRVPEIMQSWDRDEFDLRRVEKKMEFSSFADIDGGVAFPIQGQVTSYIYNDAEMDKLMFDVQSGDIDESRYVTRFVKVPATASIIGEFVFTSFEFNVPISDEEFDFVIPDKDVLIDDLSERNSNADAGANSKSSTNNIANILAGLGILCFAVAALIVYKSKIKIIKQ